MPIPVPGRVVEALRRSTVQVTSGSDHAQGNGSGVVLTGEKVVTNAHVIHGRRLSVESWEGRTLPATLLKLDRRRDLAILSVPDLNAPSASLGDSNRLRPGTPVVAVGNPLGFIGAVSSGVVHSVRAAGPMNGMTMIHADVRLAPGNSGGPLADFSGQIIGINTMIIAGGLALAIPSRAVQSMIGRSASGGSLGVTVRPVRLRDGRFGTMILELDPGGAAEKASLLPGDILVGANEVRFRGADDLDMALEQAPGSLVRFDFFRAGQQTVRRVAVKLEARKLPSAA